MSKSEKLEQGVEGAAVKPKGDKKAKGKAKVRPKRKPPRRLPPFNVVLLDDDDHTYEYVVEMLKKVFGHPEERGYKMVEELDTSGRVIVMTTHKELAELKCDQIMGYGADWRLERSRGAMTAVVEPAGDGGGEGKA
jgi:ATP-dependent Clp protease adaptor protein ClpS